MVSHRRTGDDSRRVKMLLPCASLWQYRTHAGARSTGRMDAQQLREFAAGLIETLASKDRELQHKQLKIEQLTHEMAVLKRWKFAARSEQLHGMQRSLLDETIDADLEAIAVELATLQSRRTAPSAEGPTQA